MFFNPTDKSNSIIADIDFLIWGDSSTFNDSYSLADRTRNVNISMDELVAELYQADPNWEWDDTTNTDFPIATTTLVANQDHYSLLDASSVVHRVRIKDSNGTYKTLKPKLRSEFTDSELNSTGVPDAYYKNAGAVFPVPIPNYGSAAGVELEFQRGGNHFSSTDVNVEPGFNSLFHQYLSIGASHRYALANSMREKAQFLENEKMKQMQKVTTFYALRSPDVRPRLTLHRRGNYGL